jgi:hypothetical protein
VRREDLWFWFQPIPGKRRLKKELFRVDCERRLTTDAEHAEFGVF